MNRGFEPNPTAHPERAGTRSLCSQTRGWEPKRFASQGSSMWHVRGHQRSDRPTIMDACLERVQEGFPKGHDATPNAPPKQPINLTMTLGDTSMGAFASAPICILRSVPNAHVPECARCCEGSLQTPGAKILAKRSVVHWAIVKQYRHCLRFSVRPQRSKCISAVSTICRSNMVASRKACREASWRTHAGLQEGLLMGSTALLGRYLLQ